MGRNCEWNEHDEDTDEDAVPASFDEKHIAKPEEVNAYTGQKGHCCTIEDFRLDLEGTPKSTWNKSAAYVFANAFAKLPDAPCKDKKVIAEAFATHFVGLRVAYRKWKYAGSPTHLQQQIARRRWQRKEYVSHCALPLHTI